VHVAALGYAVPGSVIAVGILIPLASLDNALDGMMRQLLGISTGLVFTGSIAALLYAYLVRFMTVSVQTVDSSLTQITPSMDAAARSLGASVPRALVKVHVPIIRGGVLTAALIVFVDVMKELPATLIVRPFNFDTLAIQAYRLASDERLAEASTASLMIVAVGLLPIILLSRTIMRSRPGC
jgi:iron(III) transport system permease protein